MSIEVEADEFGAHVRPDPSPDATVVADQITLMEEVAWARQQRSSAAPAPPPQTR